MNKPKIRTGHGFDLHRLVEGRKLILGGIEIPHHLGLLGHSDADCLIHALADAMLGALGLPDIGHHFPDNDPSNKDLDSAQILLHTKKLLKERGYAVGNIDLTLIAQRPKLADYLPSIRANLAKILEMQEDLIGLKATTHEGIGSLGREEGIAAHAVCLLFPE
jgi:2-C-methyl-D-erythritol 2,4-cyclodiphosphate synthase